MTDITLVVKFAFRIKSQNRLIPDRQHKTSHMPLNSRLYFLALGCHIANRLVLDLLRSKKGVEISQPLEFAGSALLGGGHPL